MSMSIGPLAYLRNHVTRLHEILYARCLWTWLSFLMALQ